MSANAGSGRSSRLLPLKALLEQDARHALRQVGSRFCSLAKAEGKVRNGSTCDVSGLFERVRSSPH